MGGNIQAVGRSLYSDFLVPFEISSLVLLVGAIGAIVLARPDDTPARDRELGSLFTISLGHPQESTIGVPSVYEVRDNTAMILREERETERAGESLRR